MITLIRRDLKRILGQGAEALSAVLFFAVVASLFPFAFSSEPLLLQKAAPGIIWVAALLAALLSLDAFYVPDFEDGTFDLLLMSPVSSFTVAAAKMLSHWIVSGVLLTLAAAVVGKMLFIDTAALPVILLSLLLGTLYLSLLGGMGAVLTLGSRRSGLLLAVLILPLYVPMLILGLMTAEASLAGLPACAYLLLQAALVVAALPLAPLASAYFLDMHHKS